MWEYRASSRRKFPKFHVVWSVNQARESVLSFENCI